VKIAIVEKLWKKYQKDNNPKWLADIVLRSLSSIILKLEKR
jgi:hypothetical protein